MIIIVESGSTKSDWVVLKKEEAAYYETIGLNPYFHSELEVSAAIMQNELLCNLASDVTKIFFYGAGCSAQHLNEIIRKGIAAVFPYASVHVDHDMKAAAYATFNGVPAIACILGTGSNSCFFDGENVVEAVPALGYILGDEGSGSYFGKQVLTDFLYNRLPFAMQEGLVDLGWNKDKIIESVYRKPHANVFLASFMPFIVSYKTQPYVVEMVKNGFANFLKYHVLSFSNGKDVPVNFVGSVAHFFQEELKLVCESEGVQFGEVVRRPIDGLVRFHSKNIIKV